jgi:integrase
MYDWSQAALCGISTLQLPRGSGVREVQRDVQKAKAIVNLFWRWYRHVGFDGCSSQSGRRTFITNAARKISTVGGSLRDVQLLAGHSNLRTTQGYIEANAEAQVRIVELM